MDSETFRAIQSPIKDRYRSTPDAALVTLKAEGRLGEGVTCNVKTGKALVEAGLHSATGFQRIRLTFELDSNASQEQLEKLLQLTERYCVVSQTLVHRPELSIARHA